MNRATAMAMALLLAAGSAGALTDAEKCQSSQLKISGQYTFCRFKAQAKAKGTLPDYSKCIDNFESKFSQANAAGGSQCPAAATAEKIRAYLDGCQSDAANSLSGGALPASGLLLRTGQTESFGPQSDGFIQSGLARSFTDNGDGTITDNVTGLMWEKKSDDGSIHDKDNMYTWGMATSPYTMNGTMVTTFLAALNAGSGFAGHTDWRIPNLTELKSIRNLAGGVSGTSGYRTYSPFDECYNHVITPFSIPCSVTVCSCTSDTYWSSTSGWVGFNDSAWTVSFGDGSGFSASKNLTAAVRAVRGGR